HKGALRFGHLTDEVGIAAHFRSEVNDPLEEGIGEERTNGLDLSSPSGRLGRARLPADRLASSDQHERVGMFAPGFPRLCKTGECLCIGQAQMDDLCRLLGINKRTNKVARVPTCIVVGTGGGDIGEAGVEQRLIQTATEAVVRAAMEREPVVDSERFHYRGAEVTEDISIPSPVASGEYASWLKHPEDFPSRLRGLL